MKVSKLVNVTLIGLASFCLTAVSNAQEIKAKMGTTLPDSHPQAIGARKFAELVGEKTKGRVQITVYTGGQLGSDVQMQAALRGGTQEFTVPSTATLANLVPDFAVAGLPFSFLNEKQADAVFDSPIGNKLLGELSNKDLIGLAFWENGFRHFTNSRRPILKLEDMAGLKVRTIQNNVQIESFDALGTNAVPMSANELFTALETKAVDAQENPFTVIYAQKYYDVQKYVSLTRHTYEALVLIASKKFWDKLNDGDRDAIKAASREATLFQRKASRELAEKSREALVKEGMVMNEVSEPERQRMKERLKPVYDKYANTEFAKEYFAAIERAPK